VPVLGERHPPVERAFGEGGPIERDHDRPHPQCGDFLLLDVLERGGHLSEYGCVRVCHW
jgi:hypothetical protein